MGKQVTIEIEQRQLLHPLLTVMGTVRRRSRVIEMKRQFEFEFEDESPRAITFEHSESVDEKLSVLVEHGVSVIYANRAALLVLGRTLIKMAICAYPDGFHVHLEEDFDVDKPETLRVILGEE